MTNPIPNLIERELAGQLIDSELQFRKHCLIRQS